MKIITRSVKALADTIIEELRPEYDLVYVSQGDELSDDAKAALVSGDWEKFEESFEEWESESRWDGAKHVVDDDAKAIIRRWEREDDEDYSAIASDFDGSDEWQRVHENVMDRDSGHHVKQLVRMSGDVLLRINVLDEDNCYSYEEVEPERVLRDVGMPITEGNVKTVRYALANASPEFSTLLAYWIVGADLSDLYDLGYPDGDSFVTIKNPHLYLGNPFSGSGFITEEALEGTAYVQRSDLRTDKGAFGYSVESIYGGLYASQFSGEIKAFTDVLWVVDFDVEDGKSGGHTLYGTEAEAREVARRWAADDKLTVSIYPARLCQENDPAVKSYDFQRESYFAAIGDPIAIRK